MGREGQLSAAALALALITATTQAAAAPARESFAIIIGNNVAPGTQLAPLRYGDDDAARFAELFTAAGIRVQLLVVPDADTRKLHEATLAGTVAPTRSALDRALKNVFDAIHAAKKRGAESQFY